MVLVLFSHPSFSDSQSMPRYTEWLRDGMQKRSHTVYVWTPQPFLYNVRVPAAFKKWLGYIDQYLIFPYQVKRKIKRLPDDTLFVFTDHALGPWVPIVCKRKHVIHCHDFLAQKSALGKIPRNPTSFTGRIYQLYIRRGFQKGKYFISISKRTKKDLHTFLPTRPLLSTVIYNGLNRDFNQIFDKKVLLKRLSNDFKTSIASGFILHVGGNQWYKNRRGLIKIYDRWRKNYQRNLPLLLIGSRPDKELLEEKNSAIYGNDIHFLSNINDETVLYAYASATVFFFPSIAEGFGWPIAEAMAAGCPVITTADSPMEEVGGNAAFYLRIMPMENIEEWIEEGARLLDKVVLLPEEDRTKVVDEGKLQVKKFDSEIALNRIEEVYKKIFTLS